MKLALILSFTFVFISLSVFGTERPAIQIPDALLKLHLANCPEFSSERGQYMTRESYVLPIGEYAKTASTLYILGCELYAYNSMEKAYIVDSYGIIYSVAVGEVGSDKSITATTYLMGAGFDPASQMLSTFSLGRGIGDCGSRSLYSYDLNSEKFVLQEARLKEKCDGDMESDWPVVYSK